MDTSREGAKFTLYCSTLNVGIVQIYSPIQNDYNLALRNGGGGGGLGKLSTFRDNVKESLYWATCSFMFYVLTGFLCFCKF